MKSTSNKSLADKENVTTSILYNAESCPCLNVNCDLYKKCDECIKRHHSSAKYPLTACEICKKEGYTQVHPAKYQ